MNYFKWMLVIMFILGTSGAGVGGEYYQYTDKDGNPVFTDDITRVPSTDQPGMKTYQSKDNPAAGQAPKESSVPSASSDIYPAPAEDATDETSSDEEMQSSPDSEEEKSDLEESEGPEEETAPDEEMESPPAQTEPGIPQSSVTSPSDSDENFDYKTMTAQFDREKAKLDGQLKKLQAEKKKLEKQDVKNMTKAQLNAYEEKVKNLNSRIKQQRAEQNQFKERVREFNDQLKQKQLADAQKAKSAGENQNKATENPGE